MKLSAFTDGASRGNPGPGGYGVIVSDGVTVTELGAGKSETTNNEMELQAVLEAVKQAAGAPLTIYTDSQYVVSGATKWIFAWSKNNWTKKDGEPVLHQALWHELHQCLSTGAVEFVKVPGHADLPGNERADEIATAFATHQHSDLYQGPTTTYPINLTQVSWDEAKAAARSAARKRSREQAYSYVSAVDGIVTTHQTWAECEARVKGKKARFKKALSAEEEQQIMASFKSSA